MKPNHDQTIRTILKLVPAEVIPPDLFAVVEGMEYFADRVGLGDFNIRDLVLVTAFWALGDKTKIKMIQEQIAFQKLFKRRMPVVVTWKSGTKRSGHIVGRKPDIVKGIIRVKLRNDKKKWREIPLHAISPLKQGT